MPRAPTPQNRREPLSFHDLTELQNAVRSDPGRLLSDAGERVVVIGNRYHYRVSYDNRTITAARSRTAAVFSAADASHPQAPTTEQMQRIFFPAQPQVPVSVPASTPEATAQMAQRWGQMQSLWLRYSARTPGVHRAPETVNIRTPEAAPTRAPAIPRVQYSRLRPRQTPALVAPPPVNQHNIPGMHNRGNQCYINSTVVALAKTWQTQGRLTALQAGLNKPALNYIIERVRCDQTLEPLTPSLILYRDMGNMALHHPSFNAQATSVIQAYQSLVTETVTLFGAANAQTNEIPKAAQQHFIHALYNYGKATNHRNILNLCQSDIDMSQQDAAEFMIILHDIFGFSQHPDTSLSVKLQKQLRRVPKDEQLRRAQRAVHGDMQETILDYATDVVQDQGAVIRMPTCGTSLQNAIAYFGQSHETLDPDPTRKHWSAEHRASWKLSRNESLLLESTECLIYQGAQPPGQLILQSNLTGRTPSREAPGLDVDPLSNLPVSQRLLTDVHDVIQVPMVNMNGQQQNQPYRVQSVVLQGDRTSDDYYLTVDLTGSAPMIRHNEQMETLPEFLTRKKLDSDFSLAEMCMVIGLTPCLFVMNRVSGTQAELEPQPAPPTPPPQQPPRHQQGQGLKLGTDTFVRSMTAESSVLTRGLVPPGRGVSFPAIRFVDAADGSRFSDIYEPQGAPDHGNMVSLNAGNPSLCVGGDGINGQFAEALFPTNSTNRFSTYHHNILILQQDEQGFITPDLGRGGSDPAIAGVTHSLCLPDKTARHMFIHRFDDDHCPNGNTNNRAMLYMAIPRERAGNSRDFLNDVRNTAARMLKIVHEYNKRALMDGRETLDRLRVCRFSSGIAAHPLVTDSEVAMAIHHGMIQGARNITRNDKTLLLDVIEYVDSRDRFFSTKTSIRESSAEK